MEDHVLMAMADRLKRGSLADTVRYLKTILDPIEVDSRAYAWAKDEQAQRERCEYQRTEERSRTARAENERGKLEALLTQAEAQAADNYREWGLCQYALAAADAENKRLQQRVDGYRDALAGQGQGLKQRALESLAACRIDPANPYVTISVDLVLMARGEPPREHPIKRATHEED